MRKKLSPLILLLASVIWGAAFVAQKAASELAPFTLIAVRSVFAVIFLIPVTVISDKLTGSERRLFISRKPYIGITLRELVSGALCGVFLFVASALQQIGIADTDTGKASFITALYVVIVPIYALFFGKRSPVTVWISVGLAMVGFYFLCLSGGFTLALSDLVILICAFVFAMQITCIDKSLERCEPIRLSMIQFLTSAVLGVAVALIFESPIAFDKILTYMPELLFLGIGSSGIAYTCQIIGQKDTPAPVATIILSLESVFGALAAAIFLEERLSTEEYIGCAIVFLAVVLAQLDVKTIFLKLKSRCIDKSE